MLNRRPSPLRLRRLALGLRIRDVSNDSGISDARISEIERGEGPPVNRVEIALIDMVLREAEGRGDARNSGSRSSGGTGLA